MEQKKMLAMLNTFYQNGDAFVAADKMYHAGLFRGAWADAETFKQWIQELVCQGLIHKDGERIYLAPVWRAEERAAKNLAARVSDQPGAGRSPFKCDQGIILDKDQSDAAAMALDRPLSLILGGAGSGKTSLIHALAAHAGDSCVLCAPTGKAARNLTTRTGAPAYTMHSLLGMGTAPALERDQWEACELAIIDEAGMLSLEMLDLLLQKAPADCRIALVGDENQLPAVGIGNVLDDLKKMFPNCRLNGNYRQRNNDSALCQNVSGFSDLRSLRDLAFDDSFCLLDRSELVLEASRRYAAGESIMVLSPTRKRVTELNYEILRQMGAVTGEKPGDGAARQRMLQDGNLVIITQNDRGRDCCNGDIGRLCVGKGADGRCVAFSVQLPDGRRPIWSGSEIAKAYEVLEPAYSMTVHKAQGAECDTVLVDLQMCGMMDRRLFYTAISRAKKRVLLFGDAATIDFALMRETRPRNSMLPEKVRLAMRQKKTA